MNASRNPSKGRSGIALCLSGGGYRAMLYHAGALLRLEELDLLQRIQRISAVSGGSITAAALGLQQHRMAAVNTVSTIQNLVEVLLQLSRITIDVPSVMAGLGSSARAADRLAYRYRRHLFGDATMQQLPDRPRFVLNTTNLLTGSLMRWSPQYAADYRLGRLDRPIVSVAEIVAASSAFPPLLSPKRIRLNTNIVDHTTKQPVKLITGKLHLTDGGVYDNLGLQAAASYRTILVSDGGKPFVRMTRPPGRGRHTRRAVAIIEGQVSALRSSNLVREFLTGERSGALWSIGTPLSSYPASLDLDLSGYSDQVVADVPTRLASIDGWTARRLVNMGYLGADLALRSYYVPDASPPESLPFVP